MADYSVDLTPGVSVTISPMVPASQIASVAAQVTTETTRAMAAEATKVAKTGDTMTGTLNMGTHGITNLPDPLNPQDAATQAYVLARINAVINAAPGTLDTLKELADALGDDPNFATTVTNALAAKASSAYVDSHDASTLVSATTRAAVFSTILGG